MVLPDLVNVVTAGYRGFREAAGEPSLDGTTMLEILAATSLFGGFFLTRKYKKENTLKNLESANRDQKEFHTVRTFVGTSTITALFGAVEMGVGYGLGYLLRKTFQ